MNANSNLPKTSGMSANVAGSETPSPSPEISAAAKLLGTRPKQKIHGRRRVKRTWTGFIAGQRGWYGRPVILPDGRGALLSRSYRGTATVRIDQPGRQTEELTVPASSLRVSRLSSAVALGKRKQGVREQKSLRKLEACRRNAALPAKPGRRVRGRPAKDRPLWRQFVLKTGANIRADMSIDRLLNFAIEQRAELTAAVNAEAERVRQKVILSSAQAK